MAEKAPEALFDGTYVMNPDTALGVLVQLDQLLNVTTDIKALKFIKLAHPLSPVFHEMKDFDKMIEDDVLNRFYNAIKPIQESGVLTKDTEQLKTALQEIQNIFYDVLSQWEKDSCITLHSDKKKYHITQTTIAHLDDSVHLNPINNAWTQGKKKLHNSIVTPALTQFIYLLEVVNKSLDKLNSSKNITQSVQSIQGKAAQTLK